MISVRFLVSRLIKIVANVVKLLCYVFHVFFPGKRFALPKESPAFYRAKGGDTIVPRTIWQTNYTSRVTLAVYINYLFNRLLSPAFAYRFMATDERAEFVRAQCSPEAYTCYSRLQIGAAQADFWRVLVLQKHGGVYLDIDAHLMWPLGRIVRPEYAELYLVTKSGEISNYFIASRSHSEHLEKIIGTIMSNIRESRSKNIFELTGPGVFNQVLDRTAVRTANYRYTCSQGDFTNEFFQYIDKPQGKWTRAQENIDIVGRETSE